VTFACDVMQKAGAPATLDISFRDYSKRKNPKKEFIGSPGIMFAADGRIKSGQSLIAMAAPGSWTHLELSFPLTGATREARIAVTLADGSHKEIKSAVSPELSGVSSLGFYCSDAIDGVCYLDNLRLTVAR